MTTQWLTAKSPSYRTQVVARPCPSSWATSLSNTASSSHSTQVAGQPVLALYRHCHTWRWARTTSSASAWSTPFRKRFRLRSSPDALGLCQVLQPVLHQRRWRDQQLAPFWHLGKALQDDLLKLNIVRGESLLVGVGAHLAPRQGLAQLHLQKVGLERDPVGHDNPQICETNVDLDKPTTVRSSNGEWVVKRQV